MDGVELICCYPFFLSFFLFSAQVCVIRSHPSSEERRRFFGIFLTGKGGKNILLSFFSFKLAVLNESLLCDTNNSGSRRRLNFCSFICIYVLFAATNVSTFTFRSDFSSFQIKSRWLRDRGKSSFVRRDKMCKYKHKFYIWRRRRRIFFRRWRRKIVFFENFFIVTRLSPISRQLNERAKGCGVSLDAKKDVVVSIHHRRRTTMQFNGYLFLSLLNEKRQVIVLCHTVCGSHARMRAR